MSEARYVAFFVCSECKEELSDKQKMQSQGVCPHCGHMARDATTVCETIKKVWDRDLDTEKI